MQLKSYESQISTGALAVEQDTVMLWYDVSWAVVDRNRVIKFVQSFYRLKIRDLRHERFVVVQGRYVGSARGGRCKSYSHKLNGELTSHTEIQGGGFEYSVTREQGASCCRCECRKLSVKDDRVDVGFESCER